MATIQGVYVALFGRPADPTGLAYFNSVTQNGANLNGIGDLSSTQEYKDRFAGQSNTQIVNSIYQSLFGRDAEATGLNFFVDALNKGTLNIKNIAIAILDGAQGNDKTVSANKVAAADLYTKSLDTPVEIGSYSGNTAAAQGRAFLSGVTTTIPTQASVDAAILTMQGTGAAGNTITLSAGDAALNLTTKTLADNFTTDKNDTINAGTTWSANDKIDGGLGTDKFTATIAADFAVPTDGLKNVEQIFITATADSKLDLTAAKELTQAWNDTSTKVLTFDKALATTTIGLKGALVEATTVNYADVAGTNTATVALDAANVTAGKAVTIASTEIVNIANSGASTVDTLTLDAGQNVNISGTGTLKLGIVSATVTNVDASSFTGNLNFNASGNALIKLVNGGTGSDSITVDTSHTNDITINAGAGADTITVVNDAGNATDKAISLTGGSGADIFVFGSAAGVANASGNVKTVDTAANLVKSLITINDFTKAEDSIKIAGAKDALLVGEQGQVSAATDLKAAVDLVASFTNGKATVFTYGSDAYIFADSNAGGTLNAGDTLIKITGASAADFTDTNLQYLG